MYRVLFVEDEVVMRVVFRDLIDWESSGFRLIGMASSGEEALSVLARNQADIVITDLVMSGMDGLELIKRLKANGFPGAILVLSNYSDFNLVREALTCGALDYMLKLDINGTELLKQLNAAAKKIDGPQDGPMSETMLSAELRKFFQNDQAASPQELAETFKRRGAFHLCGVRLRANAWRANTRTKPADQARRIFLQVFPDVDAQIVVMEWDRLLLLIPGSAAEGGDHVGGDHMGGDHMGGGHVGGGHVENKLRQAIREIHLYLDMTAFLVLSHPLGSPELAREAFAHCEEAGELFFYPATPPILHLPDMAPQPLPECCHADSVANRLNLLQKGQKPDAAAALLSDILAQCGQDRARPADVRDFIAEVAQKLVVLSKGGLHGAFSAQIAQLRDADSADKMLGCFLDLLSSLRERALVWQGRAIKKEVRDAMAYIHSHYMGKLSLEDVARAANLHPNYLCRLFKQETGETVSHYITAYRMERAAALIASGNTYVRDIAEQVGIDDPFYFARVFKKYHHVTPSEYVARKGTPPP